jgi:hypothetical protein
LRGIADETVDNTDDDVGGAQDIEIITPELAYFDGAGFTQADVGAPVYFSDDHTVTKTPSTNTFAGLVRAVDSATNILVDLRAGYLTTVVVPQAAPDAPAAITATVAAPAGGTGAAAGGWDTAGHRDTAIAAINALEADVANLRASIVALQALLAAAGIT